MCNSQLKLFDSGTPQFDTSRYYQSLKPQMLNGSPRHNGSPIARMNFDHPAARHDDGYATIRLPVGRNSPGSRSAVNGSGLYVRSIGHMADHNPGIASEVCRNVEVKLVRFCARGVVDWINPVRVS